MATSTDAEQKTLNDEGGYVEEPDAADPPPKPAEEEGPMGSFAKRIKCIGVLLLIYYIFSLWLPIYFANAAARYCRWNCVSNGCYDRSSFMWSSLIADAALQDDDTEVSKADCKDGCDDFCDAYDELEGSAEEAGQDALDAEYEALFSASSREERLAAWTLILLGMAFGALASIMGYVSVSKEKFSFCKFISAILFILVALMILVGSVLFSASWDDDVIDAETSTGATSRSVCVCM